LAAALDAGEVRRGARGDRVLLARANCRHCTG
jgi:hypothetical protein